MGHFHILDFLSEFPPCLSFSYRTWPITTILVQRLPLDHWAHVNRFAWWLCLDINKALCCSILFYKANKEGFPAYSICLWRKTFTTSYVAAPPISVLTWWVCVDPAWRSTPERDPAGYIYCRTCRTQPQPWTQQGCPGTRQSWPHSVGSWTKWKVTNQCHRESKESLRTLFIKPLMP